MDFDNFWNDRMEKISKKCNEISNLYMDDNHKFIVCWWNWTDYFNKSEERHDLSE